MRNLKKTQTLLAAEAAGHGTKTVQDKDTAVRAGKLPTPAPQPWRDLWKFQAALLRAGRLQPLQAWLGSGPPTKKPEERNFEI